MRILTRAAGLLMGLLLTLPAAGQYQFGDLQLSTLNGNIGGGYTGSFGDRIASAHSLSANGAAALSGFYFNPGFLSFNATPYYDQSRANSNYRSVGDSSGVAVSSSIFSGSHFPGSVDYTRDYNSSGTFALPGSPDITTHGKADNLGLRWSEILPGLPNVSVFFTQGHSQSSIYGTDATSNTTVRSAGVSSFYDLAGFHLTGNYAHNTADGTMPSLVESQSFKTDSSSDTFSFGTSHKLPFMGGVALGYNHSKFAADSQEFRNDGTVNNAYGNVYFNPTSKLSSSTNVNYTDNLVGQLNEALLAAGGVGPAVVSNSGSHSLDINTNVNYALPHDISANGMYDHRQQAFLGQTYNSDMFGGGLSTSRVVLGGIMTAMGRVADFRSDAVQSASRTNSLSLIVTLNYSRDVGLWRLTGNFSYSQNQQTLLVSYLSSFYSYGGGVHHPIMKLRWSANFAGSHSGIPQQAGTSNNSESFSTSLGSRHLTGGASYSRSNGNGVLTPFGVTPSPVPSPVLTQMILFGGKSYSFSLGSSPLSRLILSGSYSVSQGNTTSPTLASTYNTKSANALVQYRFRQMGFSAGYSRLIQGFNITGGPPFDSSTFFVGVNRWFNFF